MVAPFLLMLAAASGPATVPVAGDVVCVRDVARAPGAGELVLLRLREPAIILTRDELRRLVANRVPGLRFTLRRPGAVRLVRGPAPVRRPAAAFIPASPAVAAGQDVVLRTAVGPVVIERRVVALQPARAGKRVFVRTADGAVVSSRVPAREETR